MTKSIDNKKERIITINDLKSMNNAETLTHQQRLAMKNYERFRASELKKQVSELAFQQKYAHLQVMANLTPYEEFLKEAYF